MEFQLSARQLCTFFSTQTRLERNTFFTNNMKKINVKNFIFSRNITETSITSLHQKNWTAGGWRKRLNDNLSISNLSEIKRYVHCFFIFKQMLSKNVFFWNICAIVCKRFYSEKRGSLHFRSEFSKSFRFRLFHWKSMPTCSFCNKVVHKFITPSLRFLVQKLWNCFHNILDPLSP